MSKFSYTRRQACQIGLSGLAGLSLLDLAACGSTGSTAAATPTAANLTMELSFWGDTSRNKLTKNAINAFRKDHGNVTIKTWFSDFTNYFNKLNTEIAGGSSPDLIQMDMAYVKQYADEGQLLNLTSLISNKSLDLSDFDQGMNKNSQYNGVNYGISLGGNYESMFYDTVFVQEAGVGNPKTNMTWDEFGAYTKELSQALSSKGIVGTADASGAIDVLEIWVRQHGTELYTADGKIAFGADVIASWFTYWAGLRQSGACASAQLQATVTGSGPAAALLGRGKAVFATAHSNQFGAFQALTTDKLAILEVPTGPKPGLYQKPSMLMSIAAKSKYPQDAANFINFLITNGNGAKAIGLDRGIPGSVRARAALAPTLSANDKAVLAYSDQVTKEGHTTAKSVLDPAGASKVQLALTKAAQAVSFGTASVSAGAAQFIQACQAALA